MQKAIINKCVGILRNAERFHDDEKKTESLEDYTNVIKLRYEQYRDKKERRGEEALSFEDFVAVSIIRMIPNFVFLHVTLSFYIMAPTRDSSRGGYYVAFPSFKKWAPKLGIASPYNVDRIFVGLCNTSPNAQTTLTDGKISQTNYEGYVNRLKEQHELEQINVPGLKASGPGKAQLRHEERVIYFRQNVTDVTGMPPKVGNVALTDSHLIFQSKIRSSSITVFDLASIQIEKRKIESFIRRNNAIRLTHPEGENTWEIVGLTGRANEARNRLFYAIQQMTEAHRLAGSIEDVRIKKRILKDAADDVLRQTALQELSQNPQCPIIHFVRVATAEEKETYITELREEYETLQRNRPDSQSFLSRINLLADSSTTEGIVWDDPELNLKAFDEVTEPEDVEEVFDYKVFGRYVQQLKIQFVPFEDIHKLYMCIIMWNNPGLSLSIMITLLIIAYMDWVHYLPSLLCVGNACLLIAMNRDPIKVEQGMRAALIYAKYRPKSRRSAEAYDPSDDTSSFGFVKKYRELRNKYDRTMLGLGGFQGRLKLFSEFMGKIKTIYVWNEKNKSEIVCMASLFGGIFLYFAPLRVVFSLFVLSTFSRYSPLRRHRGHGRKRHRTIVQQFYDSIEPTIPNPDLVDEDGTQADSKSDGEDPPPPPPPQRNDTRQKQQPPPPTTQPPSRPMSQSRSNSNTPVAGTPPNRSPRSRGDNS